MVKCEDCKSSWHDDRSPLMCNDEYLKEQRPPYCGDLNPTGDCSSFKEKNIVKLERLLMIK